MSDQKKLTTASGIPYYHNEDSLSAGPRGPLLLQDFILHEKMAHFNRERIPERVVHAKGSGAYGTFTVTHDITKYTQAKLFARHLVKPSMLPAVTIAALIVGELMGGALITDSDDTVRNLDA